MITTDTRSFATGSEAHNPDRVRRTLTLDDVIAVAVDDPRNTPRRTYATGYGGAIPTAYRLLTHLDTDGRAYWRRVYVACYGNSGTAYIRATIDGVRDDYVTLDPWIEGEIERVRDAESTVRLAFRRVADGERLVPGVDQGESTASPADVARTVAASYGALYVSSWSGPVTYGVITARRLSTVVGLDSSYADRVRPDGWPDADDDTPAARRAVERHRLGADHRAEGVDPDRRIDDASTAR